MISEARTTLRRTARVPAGEPAGDLDRRCFLQAFLGVLTVPAAGLTVTGCSEDRPTVLRVGLLPDQSEENLRHRFSPLFDYVAREAGVRYEFRIPASYAELVELFETGQVDIANFGAFTFVKARRTANARPLVMRDVDRQFKSVFLVAADSPAKALQDLKGSSFSFGSKLSTSGHLMPRFFMGEQGIEPEKFFSKIVFSGTHDETAIRVQNGDVQCGALNGEIATRMFSRGELDDSRVRILWETPPYVDYVWAIRGEVSEDARIRLRDAFLSLRPDRARHRPIL